jgi:hypothetical protein
MKARIWILGDSGSQCLTGIKMRRFSEFVSRSGTIACFSVHGVVPGIHTVCGVHPLVWY